MNYRGQYKRDGLPECPICGMDSGKRIVREGIREDYYVVCETCGFKTKPHPTQAAASHEWAKLKRKGAQK